MKIRNKRTGKVVCMDAVAEVAGVIAIFILICVLFRPVLEWTINLYLALH